MNILACLTARLVGKAQTICFVGKPEYVKTFAGGTPELGIDRIVWPARMLADKIEKILAVPGATDVGTFARGQISLLEYRVREGMPIVGRPLAEVRALPPGILAVHVQAKGAAVNLGGPQFDQLEQRGFEAAALYITLDVIHDIHRAGRRVVGVDSVGFDFHCFDLSLDVSIFAEEDAEPAHRRLRPKRFFDVALQLSQAASTLAGPPVPPTCFTAPTTRLQSPSRSASASAARLVRFSTIRTSR